MYQLVTRRRDITLNLYHPKVIFAVRWEVEYTDEFESWWEDLNAEAQVSVAAVVEVLGELGPALQFPYSSDIRSSRHGKMRELRIQHRGRPYRVLYVFDPRRVILLLLGGTKSGDTRWYERVVPEADALYDRHLEALRREKHRNG
jgi:hypothetical protein